VCFIFALANTYVFLASPFYHTLFIYRTLSPESIKGVSVIDVLRGGAAAAGRPTCAYPRASRKRQLRHCLLAHRPPPLTTLTMSRLRGLCPLWLLSALVILLATTGSVLAAGVDVKVNRFHNLPARFFYFEDTEVRVWRAAAFNLVLMYL
jgi:hypothetical protein